MIKSLRKQLQQFSSFSTNVPIISEDLLRPFYHCFEIQVISEKQIFSFENNREFDPYRFSCKFAYPLFNLSYKPKT